MEEARLMPFEGYKCEYGDRLLLFVECRVESAITLLAFDSKDKSKVYEVSVLTALKGKQEAVLFANEYLSGIGEKIPEREPQWESYRLN